MCLRLRRQCWKYDLKNFYFVVFHVQAHSCPQGCFEKIVLLGNPVAIGKVYLSLRVQIGSLVPQMYLEEITREKLVFLFYQLSICLSVFLSVQVHKLHGTWCTCAGQRAAYGSVLSFHRVDAGGWTQVTSFGSWTIISAKKAIRTHGYKLLLSNTYQYN